MAYLTLNCPQCRKQMTYLPHQGLRLHYHCGDHGVFTYEPLLLLPANADETVAPSAGRTTAPDPAGRLKHSPDLPFPSL